jgi:hypothetical protein
MATQKLKPLAWGLALGFLWGFSVFFMGLLAYICSYGKPFVEAMSTIYHGYEPSINGSILGGFMGFIDAFIAGVILAWLYNFFACLGCKKK